MPFSCACLMAEDTKGWGVSEWQVAASWTVTGMVDGIDDNSFVNEENYVCWRKICHLNHYAYIFGDVLTAPFYINFLAPAIREHTHCLGTDNCFGQSWAWFCLPLHLIESIAQESATIQFCRQKLRCLCSLALMFWLMAPPFVAYPLMLTFLRLIIIDLMVADVFLL